MDWIPVSSSNLDSVAYDATSGTLYVQFKGSGTYQYSGVPQDVYDGLIKASSPGKYLLGNIKHAYAGQKV